MSLEILGDGDGCWYKAITSTNTTSLSIHLRGKLNKNSDTDTDGDGIYDWNEINVKLIEEFTGNKTKISNSDLPTFEELSDKMQEWVNSKKTDSSIFYVEQGYNQLINKNAGMYYRGDKEAAKAGIDRIKILPLISGPTRVDSDGDYMLDGIENEFVNKSIYWDIKDESIVILMAAPIEDKNKPLDSMEKTVFRKRTVSIWLAEIILLLLFLLLKLDLFFIPISLSLLLEGIMVVLGIIKNKK